MIENYGQFVAGVDEVAQVEAQLAVAHLACKQARQALALAQREVGRTLSLAAGRGALAAGGALLRPARALALVPAAPAYPRTCSHMVRR